MMHGLHPLPETRPADLGLCPLRLQRLLDALQSDIDRARLPGAVVLVARHGQVALFEHLGQRAPLRGEPMTRDTLFRIYSMTKPIVSAAVLMLVEQGRVQLEDPLSRWLPAFDRLEVLPAGATERVAAERAPTVHDLLRHTAGFTYEFLGSAEVHRAYAQARIGSRDRDNAAFCDALATLPLLVQPGTAWEYSRATDVLGRLIEVVSGESLGAWLAAHVFEPLGMKDTRFDVPEDLLPRLAEPFPKDPDGAPMMLVTDYRRPGVLESGGGGLVSTARDYARFLQFLLNRGALDGVRLLGPQIVDWMTADHLSHLPRASAGSAMLLPPGHGFGLGVAVRTAPGLAPTPGSVGMYYWGGLAGTSFFVDPALQLQAILMIQAPNQREHYRALFRNMVYAAVLD
ncbi:serine hydrolase domain-containing protein [Tibeticola sp.]|uniref:serine hydrolase domain-containing protein n=1 Tax=Tibeticola sp. TaxID=2005368 RepID=UPI00345339A2